MPYTLDDWERAIPQACRTITSYPPAAFLFRQQDSADAIFLLLEGQVRLMRHLEDGSVVILHVARSGETLAEAALFSSHYHCDALVVTPTRVMVIRKEPLLTLMTESPELNLYLTKVLAHQVRHLRSMLTLRNIRSAEARVMAWLRLHANGNTPTVTMSQTWKTVAEEIGLTHEVLYRTLAMLEKSGTIKRRGAGVVLLTST
ncbi:Crp/Fnr family transcriptional regulator [Salinispirillum marinum]|uniref:Crp/Fnr family transcriptional regulator n=2 Tax=Saccharospirillaceae TaxID=255527 RepID=A0ABV8BDF6_9GAMM